MVLSTETIFLIFYLIGMLLLFLPIFKKQGIFNDF